MHATGIAIGGSSHLLISFFLQILLSGGLGWRSSIRIIRPLRKLSRIEQCGRSRTAMLSARWLLKARHDDLVTSALKPGAATSMRPVIDAQTRAGEE